MVFMIPWEELTAMLGGRTFILYTGAAASVFGVFSAGMTKPGTASTPKAFYLLVLLVAWSGLSIAWAMNTQVAIMSFLTTAALCLFAWLICRFASEGDRLNTLLLAYLMGCVVLLGLLAFSYSAGVDIFVDQDFGVLAIDTIAGQEYRYRGAGMNQNETAMLLSWGIPIAVHLGSSLGARGKWLRMLHWAYIPAAVVGVFLTGSRGGAACMAAAITLSFLARSIKDWKVVVAFSVVAVIAITLVPMIVPAALLGRIGEMTQGQGVIGSDTFVERTQIWQAGLRYWQTTPVLGAGVGCYRWAARAGGGDAMVGHNTYISILVERGIVGSAIFWVFGFALARKLVSSAVANRWLWLTLGATWSIAAISGTLEFMKSTWLIIGVVLAGVSPPTVRPRLLTRPRQPTPMPRLPFVGPGGRAFGPKAV